LTGGQSVYTDSSNASRTMLMDINKLEWSEYMLQEFEIKRENLPEIKLSSSDDYGTVSTVDIIEGVKITG
jgi:glycerol kinase